MKASQATTGQELPAQRRSRRTRLKGRKPTLHRPLSREEYMAQFEADESWFHQHRRHLAEGHPDAKYAVVSHGIPVFFGDSDFELAERFVATYGRKPVYIGLLSGEEEEEVLSSPDC